MGVREIFKTNLKYYRKLRGLTQEQLADATNYNPKYISEIESRNKFPSPETIDAIAQALGIPVSKLFEEQGSPQNVVLFSKNEFTDEVIDALHARLKKDMLMYLESRLD